MEKLKIINIRLVCREEEVEQAKEDLDMITAEVGLYDFGAEVRDLTTQELEEVIEQVNFAGVIE